MAENIRLGFVGAGGIAHAHADGISNLPNVEIAGVVDACPEAAARLAEKTGATVFDCASEMVQDGGLDALYIFTPPFARGEGEWAALRAKLPFFVEKPLGLDEGFLNEVACEVEKQGLLTSVGYMTRYRESVQRVKELLVDEPPILAFGGWWSGSPGSHTWWTDKDKSGGQFHEQATHTLDLARYLFGEAVEVYAVAANGFNKGIPEYSLDDAVTVTIRFANGGVATLMSSCCSNAGGRIFLDLHSLNRNFNFREWEHHVVIHSKGEEPEQIEGEAGIFLLEDQVFIQSVRHRDGSGILSPYADGVRSAMVSLAANKSLRTGKPVLL